MFEFFYLAKENLLSPPILFFVLGVLAGLLKADLEVPRGVSRFLTIYLMMAIGFKGGACLNQEIGMQLSLLAVAGFFFSLLFPFLGFLILRKTTNLDEPTAAALSALYGSVSIVTFVTAANFLSDKQISYNGAIVAILAIMEAPAILSGLLLGHRANRKTFSFDFIARLFTNGAVLLLLGSFLIGWISGCQGVKKMEGFLVAPFQGVLSLFLLDMGLLVVSELNHFRQINFRLILFALYMPLIGAFLAFIISALIGVDSGTSLLFMVLAASSSYIAVPAAMRSALPEAKVGIYLPLSLAVTFPFNIMVGIPLYYLLSESIRKLF